MAIYCLRRRKGSAFLSQLHAAFNRNSRQAGVNSGAVTYTQSHAASKHAVIGQHRLKFSPKLFKFPKRQPIDQLCDGASFLQAYPLTTEQGKPAARRGRKVSGLDHKARPIETAGLPVHSGKTHSPRSLVGTSHMLRGIQWSAKCLTTQS